MYNSIRAPRKPSPKVISIPVHFVGAEEPLKRTTVTRNPATAAVKIQKVVRGFLVRKSVKKIISIRNEVEQIERRMSKVEVIELMIKDTKERIKINESLMALLFKLDSVRGVDSGVRDLRKAVIKKAIALQEIIDGIVSSESQKLYSSNNDSAVVEVEDLADQYNDQYNDSAVVEVKDSADQYNDQYNDSAVVEVENSADQYNDSAAVEVEDSANQYNDSAVVEVEDSVLEQIKKVVTSEIEPNSQEAAITESLPQIEAESVKEINQNYEVVEEAAITERLPQIEAESVKEIDQNYEVVEEAAITESLPQIEAESEKEIDQSYEIVKDVCECIEENVNNDNCSKEEEMEVMKIEVGDKNDNKSYKEMLEKMMEENEKMMKMMKQIFERNEEQTRMINLLSYRVEQMEKAFICDKMKRRKKRQINKLS